METNVQGPMCSDTLPDHIKLVEDINKFRRTWKLTFPLQVLDCRLTINRFIYIYYFITCTASWIGKWLFNYYYCLTILLYKINNVNVYYTYVITKYIYFVPKQPLIVPGLQLKLIPGNNLSCAATVVEYHSLPYTSTKKCYISITYHTIYYGSFYKVSDVFLLLQHQPMQRNAQFAHI